MLQAQVEMMERKESDANITEVKEIHQRQLDSQTAESTRLQEKVMQMEMELHKYKRTIAEMR